MTIKFEDMEPEVKQSTLRVIEDQFSRLTINGPGYEEAAKVVVSTVNGAFQSLYEDDK